MLSIPLTYYMFIKLTIYKSTITRHTTNYLTSFKKISKVAENKNK